MKKAKIMLTAVAVFAVVGGALAFKARSTDKVFCTTAGATDRCTFQRNIVTLSPNESGNLTRCTIVSTTTLCPLTYTKAGI